MCERVVRAYESLYGHKFAKVRVVVVVVGENDDENGPLCNARLLNVRVKTNRLRGGSVSIRGGVFCTEECLGRGFRSI